MPQPITPQSNSRPADAAIQRSGQKLTGMALISKAQVKLWKAMLVSVFFAGLVGALGFVAGFQQNQETGQVALEVGYEASEAALPKLPDLRAYGLKSQGPIQNQQNINLLYLFSYTIENQGLGAAGAFKAVLQIDSGNDGQYETSYPTDVSVFGVDMVKEMSLYASMAVGTTSVRVCVDTLNQVKESNESNNCTRPQVITISSKPNLHTYIDPVTRNILTTQKWKVGQTAYFSGMIENNGGGNAGPFYGRICLNSGSVDNCFSSAKGRLGSDIYNNTSFRPGDWRYLNSIDWKVAAGTYTLYVCADPTKLVEESNEALSDNCDSASFTIQSPPRVEP